MVATNSENKRKGQFDFVQWGYAALIIFGGIGTILVLVMMWRLFQ